MLGPGSFTGAPPWTIMLTVRERSTFVVARNPDPHSTLPYLLRIPLEGGIALKAREPWPRSARVYCHPLEEPWPEGAEVVEEVPVRVCRRRGPAVDLVLDRARNNRAQFVFTRVRERPAIFWQTQKTARAARPGVRVPSRRSGTPGPLVVTVDTRERYGYRFGGREVERIRAALPAGDYAVGDAAWPLAAVERKTLENLIASLVNGSLGFVMGELAALPASAVVVEAPYSALFKAPRVSEGWFPELVARLRVRYPNVPIVFAENRKLAEEWTYRFLAAAWRDLAPAEEGEAQTTEGARGDADPHAGEG